MLTCYQRHERGEQEHLAVDFVSEQAKLAQANPNGQRLYVVSHHHLKLLARPYVAYQASDETVAPIVLEALP